jgi:hypothetical protein
MVYHSIEGAESLGVSPPRFELFGRAHRGIRCKSKALDLHLRPFPQAML